MNFTSFHFLLFFFVTIIAGHLLKNRAQRVFLLLSSYYFYGVFEPWYLILILSSTLLDYVAGLGIESYRERQAGLQGNPGIWFWRFFSSLSDRIWLLFSLVFNLSLLGYFKYTNFAVQITNDLQPAGDTVFSWPVSHILLPIGISFYTFQSLSYTIDVYRRSIDARRNFTDFALYVTFFPQLVAGPIVRATTFFRDLDHRLPVHKQDMLVGTVRIVTGFFRKLVLSDNLAPLVDGAFSSPASLSTADTWIAAIAFGFQIYLDFAGYTDIARGVARLFGFEFDVNFLYPMSAANITEHWKRWHISLTTWIRDYVYIPLGGNRVGQTRSYLNLFLIWFLTGLWHGAAYHFVTWGIWQAVMSSVHRWYSKTEIRKTLNEKGGISYNLLARVFLMFNLSFGFIFFRAQNMDTALLMIGRLFHLRGLKEGVAAFASFLNGNGGDFSGAIFSGGETIYGSYAVLLVFYYLYDLFFDRYRMDYFLEDHNRWKLVGLLCIMLYCIFVFSSPESQSFLYFQF